MSAVAYAIRRLHSEQPWRANAACRDRGPSLFFGGNWSTARALCAACPVRVQCAQWAVSDPELRGFAGGMTPQERIEYRLRFATAGGPKRAKWTPEDLERAVAALAS